MKRNGNLHFDPDTAAFEAALCFRSVTTELSLSVKVKGATPCKGKSAEFHRTL